MSLRLIEKTNENKHEGALARATEGSATHRAQALLGDTPTLTLMGDADVCCTARFVRHGDVWLGIVSDHAALTDRVRMGVTPRFLFGDAAVVTVSGTAHATIVGRVGAVAADIAAAVAGLVGPWGVGDGVVVSVRPDDLVVDADVSPAVMPRT